jgi:hypothetical protein
MSIVFAQAAPKWDVLENAFGNDYNFGGGKAVSEFFNQGLINIIFFAAGAAFLFYLITAGLSMMTSRGEPKALEAAKGRITQAVVGFIVIFCAYWIVKFLGRFLGVSFEGLFGGWG